MNNGWSHKYGFIIPSWNTVIEYETSRLMPHDSSLHISRIEHTADTVEAFDHMVSSAPENVKLLADAGVDAICFACTAASFYKGRERDREFAERLSDKAGVPVVTMAGAIVESARHLGMEKVCIGAPYEQWLLELLERYLRAAGLDVLRARGLGHQANIIYSPEKAIELAENAWVDEADGIILSCGNFRTLEMLDTIEDRFRKPVVSSNSAALWNVLWASNWSGSIPNAGTLLEQIP
jgi:maleate isomerase